MSQRGKGRGRGRGRNVDPPVGMETSSCSSTSSRPGSDGTNSGGSTGSSPTPSQSPGMTAGRGRKPQTQHGSDPSLDTKGDLVQKNKPSDTTVAKFLPRPGYGTVGRPISLISNYFSLKFKSGIIFHYDVEINSLDQLKKYGKPVKNRTVVQATQEDNLTHLEHELNRNIGKLKCRLVFNTFVKEKGLQRFNPVYDGVKNIFTSQALPFKSKETFTVVLQDCGKARNYELILQPVKKGDQDNKIDLGALLKSSDQSETLILAFNCIMSHRDVPSSQVQLNRSFFYLNQSRKIGLGEGLEIWFGYNQSVHLTEKGPAVILNLAAKAFHKSGPVIDYVSDILRRDITRGDPSMKPYEREKIDEAIKGVKIVVTHLPYRRKYTVERVAESPNTKRISFDGKDITLASYYQSKYKQLKYPDLPTLFMKSPNNQIYIPFENCEIVEGQPKIEKGPKNKNAF